MLGINRSPRDYLRFFQLLCAQGDATQVERLADDLFAAYQEGRFIFLCGNGGSGSNASHFCEDLGKCTLHVDDVDDPRKKRFRVLSLTDNTPYILAWANDEGFERIFVEQLKNLASPDDVLIAISGGGNSPNILRAVEWANQAGLFTWGITGFDGGRLKAAAQQAIHVEAADMGMVECLHLLLFHWLVDTLYGRIHEL